jgi:eukaryotic-like serine/threonine-protein kinase
LLKVNAVCPSRAEPPGLEYLNPPSMADVPVGTVSMPGTVSRGMGSLPTDTVDHANLHPDDIIGDRYRFIRQVGKGAFGTVLLVKDLMIDEEIILKFLNPQVASDENIIKRFVYELRFARRITHQNVIRIYDMITFGKSSAISMEFFPSHTLNFEMHTGVPMGTQRALRVIKDVCAGMTSAHNANVVHRDLKPSNVLINDQDIVKIVDFGVASAISQGDTKLTKTGLLIGTPTYMSPEQVLGREVDARTDIYSLGIIMYEMFTGSPPYRGGDSMAIMYQHVQGQAVPPRELNPKIPQTLNAVILKAMALDPDARYQSMDELRERLETFAD